MIPTAAPTFRFSPVIPTAAPTFRFSPVIPTAALTFSFSDSIHHRPAASTSNASLVSFKPLSASLKNVTDSVVEVFCSLPSNKSVFVFEDRNILTNTKCINDDTTVEEGKLKVEMFFDSIVKVFCSYLSSGSAFVIENGMLLTNAKCVMDDTTVKVQRWGDDTKYVAKVLTRALDCDLALLSVENKQFWKGAKPIPLGQLPHLQDEITVVGYPISGHSISVTKGIVSRIEVKSYGQGASNLLCIQIDAAINHGNHGGPVFNNHGECIGVAFRFYRHQDAENIGYMIPTTVVSHFLIDCERNEKYKGFPCLGIQLQELENQALRAYFQVQSNEGVLVRRVEPTSSAKNVLKQGDLIVSFDEVPVSFAGTVPFRSNELVGLDHLVSQRFVGDKVTLGIIRAGDFMKVEMILNTQVSYYDDEHWSSYLVIGGLMFTPLSESLIQEGQCSLGLEAKARYTLPSFKGEQIVILFKVLPNELNVGYERLNTLQVLKFHGTRIRNIRHLTHLIDHCEDKFLVFEFENNFIAVLEREAAMDTQYEISDDLL